MATKKKDNKTADIFSFYKPPPGTRPKETKKEVIKPAVHTSRPKPAPRKRSVPAKKRTTKAKIEPVDFGDYVEVELEDKPGTFVYYCRSCKKYFLGPPLKVNNDPSGDKRWTINCCIGCHEATVHFTWEELGDIPEDQVISRDIFKDTHPSAVEKELENEYLVKIGKLKQEYMKNKGLTTFRSEKNHGINK